MNPNDNDYWAEASATLKENTPNNFSNAKTTLDYVISWCMKQCTSISSAIGIDETDDALCP